MTDHRPPAKRHCQSSILDLFLARCSIEDAIMNGNAKLVKEFLQLLRYPPKGKLLHLAIKSKQEEIAKILVEHGVDVSAKNEDLSSPLHSSIANGLISVTEMLIQKDANVQALDDKKNTPLHIAASKGCIKSVSALLDNGAKIHVKNKFGMTPLENAVKSGNHDIMVILLTITESWQKPPDNFKLMLDSLLIMAARYAAPKEMILTLIALGANPNLDFDQALQSKIAIPALSAALISERKDKKEIMEILIRNGANVNEKSFGGYARVRLASGDGIHREYSLTEFTPLHYAAMFLTDDIDILEMLTDNGADVDAQANYDCGTPLHHASEKLKSEKIVKFLVEHGANVNAITRDSETDNAEMINLVMATPLHYASLAGCFKTAKILIDSGANLTAKNKQSNTPLHLAVKNKNFWHGEFFNIKELVPVQEALLDAGMETVKLLINNGANLEATNDKKNTPLHNAILEGYADVAEILIQHGAKVNTQNKKFQSSLHMAVRNSSLKLGTKCIQILLQNRANLNIKDIRGETPLEIVLRKKIKPYIKTLLLQQHYL